MSSQEIDAFLSDVERSAQQRFRLRSDVAWLLSVAYVRSMENVFEDVLFFSKFVTNAILIMKRENGNADAIENLKNEFKVNLEKFHTLLRTIIKEAAEPEKGNFLATYLAITPQCMENLLLLAKELTWIKNYNLDKSRA